MKTFNIGATAAIISLNYVEIQDFFNKHITNYLQVKVIGYELAGLTVHPPPTD